MHTDYKKDRTYNSALLFAAHKCKGKLLLAGRSDDRNNQDGFQLVLSAAVMESNGNGDGLGALL